MSAPVADLAARLSRAAAFAVATPQLTVDHPGLDVDTAYDIQRELIAGRIAAGERLVGLKMGLTSKAKMVQVGVDSVIWGRLTDAMAVPDGGTVDVSRLIHPRIEPEVAFLLGAAPDPDRGGDDFAEAVTAIAPALEVIDSRYSDFRFTLPDVVADNTSAAAYVVGPWQPLPGDADLANLGVLLEVDGAVVQTGSTAAILGDPRRAYAEAVRLAAAAGLPLEAGWTLLAGAATAAVPLQPGAHVRAVVEGLGTACVTAAGGAS